MYISPEYRGKGGISQLIDVVKTEAQKQGGLDLRLCVHEDNVRAIKAYLKTGFKESMYKVMIQGL